MTIKPIYLSDNTITKNELEQISDWMLAGNRLTKSIETSIFEKQFSNWIGSKYSLFVNSGSSANLLMIYSLIELDRLRNKRAIAPAVSWATTISPLLQFSFDTVLCDCDSNNLGLDLNHLEELIQKHDPSLLILVHVLGHANSMDEIRDLCSRNDVIILEDTCEALGSSYNQENLGTIGTAGSFSFYYGHHISTIEGGMVVTDDNELYQIMLSLRSHGWSRDLDPAKKKQLEDIHQIDEFQKLYTFYNAGFNIRSTDLQAKIGQMQLLKLNEIIEVREVNFNIYKSLLSDYFCQSSSTTPLSSFAYGTYVKNRLEVYKYLQKNKIECRPLICGNISRQPFWKKYKSDSPSDDLPNADFLHDYGLYLPNHHNMSKEDVNRVAQALMKVSIKV